MYQHNSPHPHSYHHHNHNRPTSDYTHQRSSNHRYQGQAQTTTTNSQQYGRNSVVPEEQISYFLQAVCSNDVKLVTEIIKSGNVHVDETDNTGFSALMYASMNGYLNIVRKLIELGANVDQQHYRSKDTALHYAAQCGHTRTVEILIKYGQADREVLNYKSKTPYQVAKDFGHGNNKIMKDFLDLSSADGGGEGSGDDNSVKNNGSNNNRNNSSFDNNKDSSNSKDSSQQQSSIRRSLSGNNKDESLLPNKIMLDILGQTGIYCVQGMGFTLLARHNPKPALMLVEMAQNLQLENDPNALLQQMIQIYEDFDRKKDPLVSAGDLMLYSLMTQQQQQQQQQQTQNSRSNSNSQYHHHQQTNSQQYPTVENSKFATIRHYLQWKQSNREQLVQLIDLLKNYLNQQQQPTPSKQNYR